MDLGEARVLARWDDTRRVFAVRVWHPLFVRLPVNARRQVAFLFLDDLLGEEEVERWVGAFDLAEDPSGSMTADEFRSEVKERAGAVGADSWVLAEVKDKQGGLVAFVSADAGLKPIDHPLAIHYLAVRIDRGFEQLANSPESDAVSAAQDELEASLGETALPAGRVTERRTRTLWYVCEDPVRVERIAKAWADHHRAYRVRVTVKRDPGWTFRLELLGQTSGIGP